MGSLVDHVLSDLFCVFEGPGQTLPGLSPVVRAFDLSGQFLLLHPGLLDGGKIDLSPVAGYDRNCHVPVEAQSFTPDFLFRNIRSQATVSSSFGSGRASSEEKERKHFPASTET
ncbi:MAG: hypothetical protein ACYCT9_08675 [Leptospirillum sp.]